MFDFLKIPKTRLITIVKDIRAGVRLHAEIPSTYC
jgi:hypothetical protein